MKLALVQLDIAWEDRAANLSAAAAFVQQAADDACDVVVFPETFTTGFSMNVGEIAEPAGGPTGRWLSEVARKHGMNVIAGFVVSGEVEEAPRPPGSPYEPSGRAWGSDNARGRNTAVVCDRKGKRIAKYVKMHPFTFAGEDEHYVAGDGPVCFEIDNVPCSVFICYDLRFPEAFRRVARSAHVVFVIANWPAARQEHWTALLKARAIENQCFVVGVNRIGIDGNGLEYAGGSAVYDPTGGLVCEGGPDEPYLAADIAPAAAAAVRKEFPFLDDMR